MILGLDISTSVVGWCILQDDGTYYDAGYVELHKCEDLYDKLNLFFDKICGLPVGGDKLTIYIEEPLKMFMKNASMAQTIALLQRFNGMCCAEVFHWWGVKPILINPMTARKLFGVKVPRGTNTKLFILQHVKSLGIMPDSKWVYKKTGKPKDYCFDMADAVVIAHAGLKLGADAR